MFAIVKMLVMACFVGLVTGLLVIGAVGLWTGIPLAIPDFLPGENIGENIDALQQLPRNMLLAGVGGFAIGCFGGAASQIGGQRINATICVLLVGLCAVMTIRWTHPGINLTLESGWLDYLESYRLTLLAAIGGTIGVTLLGWMLKPFDRKDRN